MSNISRQIFDGAKYTLSFSMVQYILFIFTQVVLARLISPEIFGEFAIISIYVMFFFTLSNFQSDKYIITKKDISNSKFNAILKFDLIISTVNYFFFFLIVYNQLLPNIDYQYKNQILLFGLIVFYHPLSRKKALLEKELNFFNARYPATIATILSSIISVILAFNGYTISALILSNTCCCFCKYNGETILENVLLSFVPHSQSVHL